jgi:hypothetical protein
MEKTAKQMALFETDPTHPEERETGGQVLIEGGSVMMPIFRRDAMKLKGEAAKTGD